MTVIPLPVLPRPSTSPSPSPSPLSPAAKVASHPCYSQEAHQRYARMHLPVAPGCNIQCNYCNRKFDCSNESRPGVTSTLLSPDDAVAKVKYVASRVPQLSVVGIAGPGEPLANARRTLGTLERLARETPDVTLCVSTNGLTLLDHVDRLAELGVGHVTVTVNMTDPEVGERIYPWITFRGRRWTGPDASRVLSERQLAGIAALVERGILCKVNSVMIPGVNDEHLVEVSRTVRDLGAFLHNVMPLVSAPEHGTVFGLCGQRGPTPQELQALQDRCEQLAGSVGSGMSMGLMRHCRRCRADAVGMLGEDRNAEFAELPALGAGGADRSEGTVLVAVATSGDGVVDQHFGHADEFWIYEAGPSSARLVGTRSVARYCSGPSDCGQADRDLDRTVKMLADCAAVLCTRAGTGPRRALAAAGVEVVEVFDLVEPAVARVGARATNREDT